MTTRIAGGHDLLSIGIEIEDPILIHSGWPARRTLNPKVLGSNPVRVKARVIIHIIQNNLMVFESQEPPSLM